ncbi:penicillin-binding transpeptidase domain-containing protein [Gordonia sp. GONU]|uniref:penicillin-binding transpeptidase domain-containing protein n=1 Tax=Gordonia sp. GONU TaxID=2972949 RepID=UPI0021AC764F|nr:penicillin-binding transpeptidase domain-containing protein [Gordonia sp. GONU]MCR8899952.1 penicillin-binding transpeptidase domain-containing protein [Gordonia sp. GONU]
MRRLLVILSVLAVLVGTLSGCFLSERFSFGDSPEDTLQSFADALQRGDVDAAAGLTDDPTSARTTIRSIFDGMGSTPKLSVVADLVDDKKVTGTLDHQWQIRNTTTAYQTSVVLAETDAGWRVRWQPSVMHRQLRAGQSFSYSDDRAYRTPVLDTNARPLMTWQPVTLISLERAQLASAEPLARALRPVEPSMTAAGIRKLFDGNNAPRQTVIRLREADIERVRRSVESTAGVTTTEQGALLSATKDLHSPAMSGLEDIWRGAIDATAGWSIQIVDKNGTPTHLVDSAQPGTTPPIRTSIDRDIQTRAQRAVDGERRPAMIVAISPSTGGIVAVAQNDAADRSGAVSLTGLYPPGSTFKTITTAAALATGVVQPTSQVPCPGRTTIEGRTIPNEDDFDLGTVALPTAFSRSCNTTMGALANRLPADGLTTMARRFGIGADYTVPGLTTVTGRVPVADTPALRVENGIGQGTVTVSPFGLALAEASLARGETVTPTLVEGQRTTGDTEPEQIPDDVVRALRSMMRDIVTRGTATALQDIPDLGGKTGTAEYGDNKNPHGWFAGIVGDLAFATLVVGGGSSAPAVAVSGEFLRPLRR